MTPQIKLILAATIATLALSTGWAVSGWQTSKTIAELSVEQPQCTATRAEAARADEI